MPRPIQEINAGSMADIAFILLIFFLVTTNMDVDTGISRKLPPMPKEQQETTESVKERNVLIVLLNMNDKLLVEGERLDISELRAKTKEFVVNPVNNPELPEKELLSERLEKAKTAEEKAKIKLSINLLGDLGISKGVISLQNDRGTSYGAYISVQNELTAAYDELRDELSIQHFGKKFEEISEEEADAVKLIYPMAISEAEPKNIGGVK